MIIQLLKLKIRAGVKCRLKDLVKLENELTNNYINKKVDIIMAGDIDYILKIDNMRFLLNSVNLILSDKKENQLIICLDEVGDFIVNDKMIDIVFNYSECIKLYV